MVRETPSSCGRTEQLWSCCEPARADPSWEKASVRASPAGPSFGTDTFTLSSTSGFLFPQNASWRAAGVEKVV